MDTIGKVKKLNDTLRKVLEECPEVIYIGNKILREKTIEVTLEEDLVVGEKLKNILAKYRKITGFGRGLAAPQIGESKAICVTYVNDVFKIYINPKITKSSSDFNLYRESCLSCGYLSVDVKRPDAIEIEYMDEQGDIKNEHIDNFLARLIQHEFDHLQGIVNIDKAEKGSINFMTEDPLKEQLRKI